MQQKLKDIPIIAYTITLVVPIDSKYRAAKIGDIDEPIEKDRKMSDI